MNKLVGYAICESI